MGDGKTIAQRLLGMIGRKQRPSDVIVHDPAAKGPRDLDDPLHDSEAQARVGEAIASAMRKK